ncbi:MAG: tetratricopeptide repeat protein [Deltaproteobacteria bacterium]|nr:tetratricopeptide repeat protein [Deltaproteobacteria bacterium]
MLRRGYPGRAKPHYEKAAELAKVRSVAPADILWTKKGEVDPSEAIRAEGMAQFYLDRGEYDRAAEQLEISLSRDPENAEAWRRLGELAIEHLQRPDQAADCVHALWFLGQNDQRAEQLALRFGQAAPPIPATQAPALVSQSAGTGLTADGSAVIGGANKFTVGSRVFRTATLSGLAGPQDFRLVLIGPGGKATRQDEFHTDNVAGERRVTVFDTLTNRGTWTQEWWVDGKSVGSFSFDVE